jgi:hypothetical protein
VRLDRRLAFDRRLLGGLVRRHGASPIWIS